MNKTIKTLIIFFFLSFFPFLISASNIGTIDSEYKYAWGENVGWINFKTEVREVTVTNSGITGYAWGENIGWINLNGVTNNSEGILGGYAWGENVGWINFNGVTINKNGEFNGYAWGENVGWINFNPESGGVKTSWRPTYSSQEIQEPQESNYIEQEAKIAEIEEEDPLKILEEYKSKPSYSKTEETKNEVNSVIRELSMKEEPENIELEDPREAGILLYDIFEVKEVLVSDSLINEEGQEEPRKVIISGFGPPDTLLVLYIFSTPIIVTVKTDSSGMWSYTLDKELEDGSHEVYVASVDNTGKVIAKSNPFFFVKEAAAITEFIPTQTVIEGGFFQRNLFLILLSSLILIILSGIVLIGVKRK